jgi:hypothetical protein
VLTLPRRNPEIARDITVLRHRTGRKWVAGAGIALLAMFLVVHVQKDLAANVEAWYFRSTYLWLAVMSVATAIYVREVRKLRRAGVDVDAVFSMLPPE